MSDTTPSTKFLDLPVDVLYLIFPHLAVTDFISLTSTCSALHQSSFSQYAPFWAAATRNTFRVPNQPVVENDGSRWRKMYKRLRTQSKVFTWGNNEKGCLGHSTVTYEQLGQVGPAMRGRLVRRSRHVSWPQQMMNLDSVGIVADLQCGGWSTTMLSSKGALWSVGALDGQMFVHHRGRPNALPMQKPQFTPTKLRYPPGLPHPNDRYEPATAVRQFSSGRAHVLAVSDSGRIWSWQNIEHAAYNVKFWNVDLREQSREDDFGYVRKVVAGWNKSCALVNGAGIVVWDPISRENGAQESEEDAALILETAVAPLTAYQQSYSGDSSEIAREGQHIGEIQNFICLEDHLVFNTHLGKAFAARITWNGADQAVSEPVEIVLPTDESDASSSVEPPTATDVQGSFRSFAIFTSNGGVLTGDQDMISNLINYSNRPIPFKRIPALQNASVISLAFGDYHLHALHASGHITSYGTEPQGCGALGLGGHGDPEGRLRGLRYTGIGGDGKLVPHAYTIGRRVWFEQEKENWITFLTSGGVDPEEARERMRMCADTSVQGEVSEWVEQEGRAWEQKMTELGAEPGENARDSGDSSLDDDGLCTYFALSVTAAGWHSGALVLVNEDLARSTRERCLVPLPLPSDDTETQSPGEVGGDSTTEAQSRQDTSQGQPDSLITQVTGMISRLTTSIWPAQNPNGPMTANTPNNGSVSRPVVSARHDASNPHAFLHPSNHGAADQQGRQYVWAGDSFPRLVLRHGREMPGSCEFSQWRDGRPEWDLSFEVP
ncbi:hypothetical protein AAFC00_002719 [Neodothiora populina]|uniref:F-box domain-containing protein n=1 Tax=Neodothiora populina TaxID=2781224 RepID=A0ABR3P862_9PEZI